MLYNTYERGWLKNPTQEDVEQVFREAYENGLHVAREGKCADYIPALDQFGNSVAAVKAMEHISHRLGLHVFEYEKY